MENIMNVYAVIESLDNDTYEFDIEIMGIFDDIGLAQSYIENIRWFNGWVDFAHTITNYHNNIRYIIESYTINKGQ